MPQLVRALTTFPVLPGIEDKRALPAWCPARFREGGRRCAADVLDLSCLVLDLDDGSGASATAPWAAWHHVLHSTWSHTSDTPRLRLLLPLARPVPVDCWAAAWTWAAERTPGVDTTCRDPARLYFRPALRREDQPRLAEVHEGPLLDLLAEGPQPVAPTRPAPLPSLCVPHRRADALARARLRSDPASRERAAVALGARSTGTGDNCRAEGVACPACGRPSVWFFLAPSSSSAPQTTTPSWATPPARGASGPCGPGGSTSTASYATATSSGPRPWCGTA